jgi:hypothetical protein
MADGNVNPTQAATAAIACAGQAQGNADLTAGRAGKELAQGDQFGVTALAQPTPPGDELVAKIPKVRNRAAEGSKPQAQENQEHRPGTSGEWAKRENSG